MNVAVGVRTAITHPVTLTLLKIPYTAIALCAGGIATAYLSLSAAHKAIQYTALAVGIITALAAIIMNPVLASITRAVLWHSFTFAGDILLQVTLPYIVIAFVAYCILYC